MGRRVAVMLARLIAEAKLGKDKNYEKKINEKSINKKKIKTKINGTSINKKKIKTKIDRKSINKKKERLSIAQALLKDIKTKSHGGLGACPMDKNVNSAKSSSREAAAFAIQKQKRGMEYGTA